jgi:hypothetical protein
MCKLTSIIHNYLCVLSFTHKLEHTLSYINSLSLFSRSKEQVLQTLTISCDIVSNSMFAALCLIISLPLGFSTMGGLHLQFLTCKVNSEIVSFNCRKFSAWLDKIRYQDLDSMFCLLVD